MPLVEAEAPLAWAERAFDRGPAVRVAFEMDACGVTTITATPRRKGLGVTIAADGELLLGGVGPQTWTGPLPLRREGQILEVTATAHPGRRTAVATAEVRPADVLAATLEVPATARAYEPVTARIGLAQDCPDGIGYELFVDQGRLASFDGTTAGSEPAAVTFQPWEGEHTVSGWARVRGWRIPVKPARVVVAPVALDLDRDGAADDTDCDDADPFTRPGYPDVPYDGRDNDCDGALAGDADHDGYDADRARPKRLDAAARTALAAAAPDAAFESALLGAPRLRDPDCDDSDPTRHPGAFENEDRRDDDCDGKTLLDTSPRFATPDADPGATFATATWAAASPATFELALGPGDTDVIAFRQPGVRSVTDLALTVRASGPVWVELWSGGPVADAERVVVGPRPAASPILRARVGPDDPLSLPPPPPPPPPSKPSAGGAQSPVESTWTGALWRGVSSFFDGDGRIDGGEVALTFGAAMYAMPFTVMFDYVEWQAARGAARAGVAPDGPDGPVPSPTDARGLDDGELLYLVVRGVPPVAEDTRARVTLGR